MFSIYVCMLFSTFFCFSLSSCSAASPWLLCVLPVAIFFFFCRHLIIYNALILGCLIFWDFVRGYTAEFGISCVHFDTHHVLQILVLRNQYMYSSMWYIHTYIQQDISSLDFLYLQVRFAPSLCYPFTMKYYTYFTHRGTHEQQPPQWLYIRIIVPSTSQNTYIYIYIWLWCFWCFRSRQQHTPLTTNYYQTDHDNERVCVRTLAGQIDRCDIYNTINCHMIFIYQQV